MIDIFKQDEIQNECMKNIPVVIIGNIAYPYTITKLTYTQQNNTLNSLNTGSYIFLISDKSYNNNTDLKNKSGVLCILLKKTIVDNNKIEYMLFQKIRAIIDSYNIKNNQIFADITIKKYTNCEQTEEYNNLMHNAKNLFSKYAKISNLDKSAQQYLLLINDANAFIDYACTLIHFNDKDAIELFNMDDTIQRLNKFISNIKNTILNYDDEVTQTTNTNNNLGNNKMNNNTNSNDDIYKRIIDKHLSKDIEDKLLKEYNKIKDSHPLMSQEYASTVNYINCVLDLPFNERTIDNNDICNAKQILDSEHYGLESVKERIIEYLAVFKLVKNSRGCILCFYGPPGVGKTTIARSIAKSLGRKLIRISLGGITKETEIRGFNRSYLGATPGRIIKELRNTKSKNPVIILDEIDKVGSETYNGNPSNVLLELLDYELNNAFRDEYLDIPFDLSEAIFIATANDIQKISSPLLDRMELVEFSSYTIDEKIAIAKNHLIKREISNNGLKENFVNITDEALYEIIEGYTQEAGVREFSRQISKIMRKIAVKYVEDSNLQPQLIEINHIEHYLGIRKYINSKVPNTPQIGYAIGLAWTSVGGTLTIVESKLIECGNGELLLTGQLGDILKESATTAFSYIKSNLNKYDIKKEILKEYNIHIHMPEGAVPKDGPSAGITLALSIMSTLTNCQIRNDIAMTGEITLTGEVLQIGGLKEKVLAAYRNNIKTVIIPIDNKSDITKIPENIRNEIKFICVNHVDEVFQHALLKQ